MVLKVNQLLGVPPSGYNSGYIDRKTRPVFRELLSGFSMRKAPGYTKEGSRMRFQRRVPPDVQHAFGGAEWIRIPLNFPTEREAKCSAVAWYVIHE
jgi:hypothetical protein